MASAYAIQFISLAVFMHVRDVIIKAAGALVAAIC